MNQPLTAGLVVALVSLIAVVGPGLGLSPWWISLATLLGLGGLSLDAARFGGRGGHLLAEALPGGQARLRRIAIHEAGHVLVAGEEGMAVDEVLVGSLACLRAGLSTSGSTRLEPPQHAKLPPEELRRWSRVLQAGMVAERLREQRRARREVEQWLRQHRSQLEQQAEVLLAQAPRLGRPGPSPDPDPAPR